MTTVEVWVTVPEDDGYGADDGYDGYFDNTYPPRAGTVSGNEWQGYWRIAALNVPQGAVISSATFGTKAVGRSVSSPWPVMRLRGDASDNSSRPTSVATLFSKTRTTAEVTFTPASATADVLLDVTAIVQEVVNRPGWVSGNALTLLLERDDLTAGYWQFTHNQTSSFGAYHNNLLVTYTVPTPVASLTESFTRANGLGVGADHIWAYSEPGAFSTVANAAEITSGVYTAVHARCTTPLTTDNHRVLFGGGKTVQNAYPTPQVCVRMSADGQTFYAAERDHGNGIWRIVKYINGVRTVLADYLGYVTSLNLDGPWGLEVNGSTLTFWQSGSAQAQHSITDTSITTGKYVGFGGLDGQGFFAWDDMTATALAATATDQHESGGSTATVNVNPDGAGTAAETASGGSTATVSADAQAGGSFREVAYWSEPEVITVGSSGGTLMPWLGVEAVRPWEGVGPDTYLGVAWT